jgi:hypothetical protein
MEAPAPVAPTPAGATTAVLNIRLTPEFNIDQRKKAECICGRNAVQETFTVNSDQDRQRAEKIFKKEERARDGRKAMTEYETQARATRAKTERLKALRLAKEAQVQTEEPPARPTKLRITPRNR